MIKISPSRPMWKRVLQDSLIYEISVALGAAGIGIVGALKFFKSVPPETSLGWLSVALVTTVLLGTLAKLVVQWRSKSRQENPHELSGCLHTLHAILTTSLGEAETDPSLRLTVHLVVEGDRIEQLMNYVGDDRGEPGKGRMFRASCGITGKSIKNKGFVVAKRKNDDYSLYLKELVETQDYKNEEAKKLNSATMSWAAMPLVDEQKVFAIVYCDATVRDFFNAERQTIILGAGAGIARFVKQRYNG